MSLPEAVDIYGKARQMMSETQAAIESLAQFMTARAALEESYAKNLAKLSKAGLNVNGPCWQRVAVSPAIRARRKAHPLTLCCHLC